MKYPARLYARALVLTLAERPAEEKRILERFVGVVRKNGDWSRIEKIVAAAEELMVRQAGGRMVKLEFARTVPEETISQFRSAFGERDRVRVSLNPRLVAGVRISIDGEKELDNSLERKLSKLFAPKA